MSTGRVQLRTAEPDAVETPAAAPTPGSVVARLRANAQAQQRTRTKELPVGGEFGDQLFIKYGVLQPDEMDRFVASRQGVRNIADISATSVTMDMMARACICLIGRVDGEEEVLQDDQGVIKLEDRLARMLELRAPDEPVLTSYDVINRLFGRNGAAITKHGDDLTEWMVNPTSEGEKSPGEPSDESG